MFRNPKAYHFHVIGDIVQEAYDLRDGHSSAWYPSKGRLDRIGNPLCELRITVTHQIARKAQGHV
jgi:hypothetical protein